jgi:hypothetical protein
MIEALQGGSYSELAIIRGAVLRSSTKASIVTIPETSGKRMAGF